MSTHLDRGAIYYIYIVYMCAGVCVFACVRACVRACVGVCGRACVCVRATLTPGSFASSKLNACVSVR